MTIYTYRVDVLMSPAANAHPTLPDVKDFDVEARDGHIGRVDEASYDDSSSCLVVDTGFWIFGKKRMIPAGVVSSIDVDEKKVYVSMTKDQIKQAPDYDANRHDMDAREYHKEVGQYYEPYGSSGRRDSVR